MSLRAAGRRGYSALCARRGDRRVDPGDGAEARVADGDGGRGVLLVVGPVGVDADERGAQLARLPQQLLRVLAHRGHAQPAARLEDDEALRAVNLFSLVSIPEVK